MRQNFYKPKSNRGVYDSDADDTFSPPRQQLTTPQQGLNTNTADQTVSDIDDVLAQNDAMRQEMSDDGSGSTPPNSGTGENLPEESSEQINQRENAGLYKPDDRGSEQEANALNANNLLGENSKGGGNDKKKKFSFNRRKVAAGGFGGTLVGFLIFFAVSMVTGPGQFVQLGHLLEKFHYSAQEDASDTQVSRIIRYLKNPAKPQDVRIGYIGTKIANKVDAKMAKFGIETSYTQHFGFRDGWILDPACAQCEWKGKSSLEVQKYMKTKYGVDVTPTYDNGRLKFYMNADQLGYVKGARFVRGSLKLIGYNGMDSAFMTRVAALRGGAYGFLHPVKAADAKLLKQADYAMTWARDRARAISEGSKTPVGIADGCTERCTPQQRGDSGSSQSSASETASEADTANKGVLEGDSGAVSKFATSVTGKITIGGAAAAGVLCMVKAVAADANNKKQQQVILPAIRMSVEAIALGGQILFGRQAGQTDINLKQLGLYKKQMYDAQTKTSWYQADSIQHELGKTGGVPPSDTLRTVGSGTPFDGFLSQMKPILDPICDTPAGQAGMVAISFLGGPVSALVGLAAGYALGPPVMSAIAGWLAGDALNIPGLVGASYGHVVNFGAFFASNQASIASAGSALTAAQTAELNSMRDTLDRQEMANQNFAYRMFNTEDGRSFVSQLALSINPSIFTNVQTATTSLLTGVSRVGSAFGALGQFTPGHAYAAAMPYNYGGIPKFGFSVSDMDSDAAKYPDQNAENASRILNSSAGNGYIERVKKCFGDEIYQTTEDNRQVWDVRNSNGYNQPVSVFDVQGSDCTDRSDDWRQIRFFIMNTMAIKSIACYEGEDDLCADVGFGGQTTNTTNTSSAVDIAHLYDDSTSVPCVPPTKELGFHTGYHNGSTVRIRLCALPNLDSTSEESRTSPRSQYYIDGAEGKAIVNSRVSGLLYKLVADAKTANIPISAVSSFRLNDHQADLYQQNCGGGSCDPPTARAGYSNHQMGLAIDFNAPQRSGTVYDWLAAHAEQDYGVRNISSESWHWYIGSEN